MVVRRVAALTQNSRAVVVTCDLLYNGVDVNARVIRLAVSVLVCHSLHSGWLQGVIFYNVYCILAMLLLLYIDFDVDDIVCCNCAAYWM